tara:strand:- start:457 stop:837 length:381 start_codon:yes stop_codon:yes gene_type:complete
MSGPKRLSVYAALSLTVASSAIAAEALVTKGDESYRFVVSQCLQDIAIPGSPSRVDLQLDGVPAETPAAIIEKLRGVTNDPAAAGKLLQEVVRAGPVLSVPSAGRRRHDRRYRSSRDELDQRSSSD